MNDDDEPVALTPPQIACLEALRQGADGKLQVALSARLSLRPVSRALEALREAGLAEHVSSRRWCITERGRGCRVATVPEPRRRGRPEMTGAPREGTAAARLLALLDRPRRGEELVERLGVTRQRVHQLVVRLHAGGRLRFGDPGRVLLVVARSDDPTVLLTQDEERMLSAFPERDPTSPASLSAASGLSRRRAAAALSRLEATGLVEAAASDKGPPALRLAPAGAGHVQRREGKRRARQLPLAVRSDRVASVLGFIAAEGPVRIREIGTGLALPPQSTNALLQYLKRKGLVRTVSQERRAPYELTPRGRETLQAMHRRAPGPATPA